MGYTLPVQVSKLGSFASVEFCIIVSVAPLLLMGVQEQRLGGIGLRVKTKQMIVLYLWFVS